VQRTEQGEEQAHRAKQAAQCQLIPEEAGEWACNECLARWGEMPQPNGS